MKDKKGFTLIEVLAVIVILAVIAGLIIPNIKRYKDNPSNTIGSVQRKEFKNDVVNNLSLNVATPTGLTGKIVLIVTPILFFSIYSNS